MGSALYQSIELLSQEKGIDPAIVVGAVEEAIALATRKYYKTQENMRGELNKETGEISAYIYKTVVSDDDRGLDAFFAAEELDTLIQRVGSHTSDNPLLRSA